MRRSIASLSCCDSAWMLRLSTLLSDRAGLMMKVSALARPATYSLAESHRQLKDLAVAGDAVGAAEELTRHLAGTISALESILRPIGPGRAPNETMGSDPPSDSGTGSDEVGHVGRLEEFGGDRGAERVQELVALPVLRTVEILSGDAIDVGGVLDERPARIAEIPEPVRPDRMTTHTPHVAIGVDVHHLLPAAHDVVDVVDLERDVVREGDRGGLDRDVVMDLAASCEGDDPRHLVADLEAENLREEPQRRGWSGVPYTTWVRFEGATASAASTLSAGTSKRSLTPGRLNV